MADKKISELDLALLINNDAVFPMSQDNAGEPTTFKVGITQLGTKIAEDMTFSNLRTTSKKLVGAINELLSLGNPIIIGTTAPTSSQGADGNIYVQYTEGTGGADDEVDGIFVKIDGAWCEIQTGGGSGTTDYEDLSNKPQVNSVELVGNKSLDDLGIMPASLSKTVSGSIAHFTDGADNIPVKSLECDIGSDGFSQADITVCGKNLFNLDKYLSDNNVSYTKDGEWFLFNLSNDLYNNKFDLPLDNYSVSFIVDTDRTTAVNPRLRLYKNGGIEGEVNANSSITKAIDQIGFNFSTAGTICCKVQAEFGTTTSYEPYNSNTYTISFGSTFNDGVLKYENGEWFIDESGTITPISSSTRVKTISGENNIFSNCGDVEVNYYTDNADEIVEVSKATASTPLHHYSTDEHVVGTWIDGSTLYEKTQYGGISMTEAETWYDTSIIGIDKAVMVSGSLLRSGEEVGLGTFNSRWIVRNNTVKISLSDLAGDTWSLMSITVRYTKSSS